MTPEKVVKQKIKSILEELGVYYFMPGGTAYGHAGVPDFVGCINGKFFAIEAKATKGHVTALQLRELNHIANAKGFYIIVNPENLNTLKAQLFSYGHCDS